MRGMRAGDLANSALTRAARDLRTPYLALATNTASGVMIFQLRTAGRCPFILSPLSQRHIRKISYSCSNFSKKQVRAPPKDHPPPLKPQNPFFLPLILNKVDHSHWVSSNPGHVRQLVGLSPSGRILEPAVSAHINITMTFLKWLISLTEPFGI